MPLGERGGHFRRSLKPIEWTIPNGDDVSAQRDRGSGTCDDTNDYLSNEHGAAWVWSVKQSVYECFTACRTNGGKNHTGNWISLLLGKARRRTVMLITNA